MKGSTMKGSMVNHLPVDAQLQFILLGYLRALREERKILPAAQ